MNGSSSTAAVQEGRRRITGDVATVDWRAQEYPKLLLQDADGTAPHAGVSSAARTQAVRATFKHSPATRLATPPRVSDDRITALQQWEGVVDEVSGDAFTAILSDRTAETPDERAEFSLDELSRSDFSLVRPGAIFAWTIGYRDMLTGQRIRFSTIRFRRLPAWTQRELDHARVRASHVLASLEENEAV
jgi:hypothetical protein